MPDLTRSVSFLRQVQLEHTRATLLQLGVPQATVDQVSAEDHLLIFSGYVWTVITQAAPGPSTPGVAPGSMVTTVWLEGKWSDTDVTKIAYAEKLDLQFPPNDPKFLTELIRAQNNPHFQVTVYVTTAVTAEIVLLYINWDYHEPKPIRGAPPI